MGAYGIAFSILTIQIHNHSYIKEVMYNLLIQHKCYYITETKIQTTWFGFLLNPSEHKTPFLNVSIIISYFCCIEVLHGLAIGVPCEQTILNVDQRYPISKQEARKTTQQARPTPPVGSWAQEWFLFTYWNGGSWWTHHEENVTRQLKTTYITVAS